jgi:hypothetical protein
VSDEKKGKYERYLKLSNPAPAFRKKKMTKGRESKKGDYNINFNEFSS